jgi:hypothetical protein
MKQFKRTLMVAGMLGAMSVGTLVFAQKPADPPPPKGNPPTIHVQPKPTPTPPPPKPKG